MHNARTALPKRLIILAFDALCAVALAAYFLLALPQTALAYVDPSVMTYTIQALAGVAVALGAVAGVALRRTRKAIFKLLKIDENANKPQECEVHRCAEGQTPPREARYLNLNAAKDRSNAKMKLPVRIGIAIVAAIFLVITAYTLPALELISANAADLIFDFSSLWPPVVIASLIGVALITIILSILPTKAFRYAVGIVAAIGICIYIQGMFLNTGIPAADGSTVDWWGSYSLLMIVSLLVWILIIIAGIVFVKKGKALSTRAFTAICAILIIVQGIGLGSVFASSADYSLNNETDTKVYMTEDGLWDVASSNNTIVFVLDFYDTRQLEKIAQGNDALFDGFDGFTWYKNSAGVALPTAFAIPYLLTGCAPSGNSITTAYFHDRYANSTFIPTVKAAGISTGIYSDGLMMNYFTDEEIDSFFVANIDNIHRLGNMATDAFKTAKMLLKCCLYRDVPWMFKSRFRYYTDDLNQNMVDNDAHTSDDRTPYITDDANYLEKLQEYGLEVVDEYNGAFRFIHLNGTHTPNYIDKEGKRAANPTADETAEGCLYIVKQYLAELKRLGVYDDATIIVTADHGIWQSSNTLPTEVTSPILLYKPSQSDNEPLSVSNAQVSQTDFFDTVLDSFGIVDTETAYSGITYDEAPLASRERTVFREYSADGRWINGLYEYIIDGNALDFEDWHYTGKFMEVTGYRGALD